MTIETTQARVPTHHVEGRRHDGTTEVLGAFYSREEADAEHVRYVFGGSSHYDAYRVVAV